MRYVDPDGREWRWANNPKAKARFDNIAKMSPTFKAVYEAIDKPDSNIRIYVEQNQGRADRQGKVEDVQFLVETLGLLMLQLHVDYQNSYSHDDQYAHELGHVEHAIANRMEFILQMLEESRLDPATLKRIHDNLPVEQRANQFMEQVMREIKEYRRAHEE